ncbi:hypothetical protein TrRE_jg4564, partial [Triparma retinervis]
ILDLTFGFGSDSLLLLAASTPSSPVTVHGTERDPRVYALSSRALADQPTLSPVLSLRLADVTRGDDDDDDDDDAAAGGGKDPTVVYVDAMFPARRRSRSRAKGPMELLRVLHSTDTQDDEIRGRMEEEGRRMLEFGMRTARERVVCKRPKGAEPMGGVKPDFQVGKKGANIRYDVYIT